MAQTQAQEQRMSEREIARLALRMEGVMPGYDRARCRMPASDRS